MATQTATDFALYPVRTHHNAVNRMHTNMVTTISASASDEMYMFPIPSDCMVTGGVISASGPAGLTTNVILQVGWKNGGSGAAQNETQFGVYTVSGSAALAATRLSIYAPKTVSGSGYGANNIATIAVLSAGTTTTSISIYLMLEYVMPGNVN